MSAIAHDDEELRELERQAAGLRGGQRLLILPGIMGSTIGRPRTQRPPDITWFDPVELALGRMLRLALPRGSQYRAVDVLRFAYRRLQLRLRIAGFDADYHPYDWRLSLADSGKALIARLAGDDRRDVILVAHSMGGLVARAALAHPGSERIARVIQLGTPNRGAFATVQALRGTYPLVRRLALLDLVHGAGEIARDMLVTLPGLCELLPPAEACKDFDPFDARQWPAGPHPAGALLQAAAASRAALPAPDGRFALIAGQGRDTLMGLRRRNGQLEFARSPAGDGTVPLALAQLPGLPVWFVDESHGALPGNAAVAAAIAELARSGTTTALPAALPRRPGLAIRWEDDLRAADEEKIHWDDLPAEEQLEFLHEFLALARPAPRPAPAESVRIGFVECEVTATPAPALVLGTFANVAPAGAALAVDAALDGAIRDLSARRALGSAAGEVFMLPVPRGDNTLRFVVLAGLGDFHRYGEPVQRLAAANVTRTLARAGVRGFAMVLWGTASGLDPRLAARAQVEGVLAALDELDPQLWPRQVMFVSRSRQRLALAREAVAGVLARHPLAAAVRLAPLRHLADRAPPAPAATATSIAYLFVHEESGELRASLLGTTPKATALSGARKLDPRALQRAHQGLAPGMPVEALERFGEELGQLLLPATIREALAAVREAPLVVVHDAASGRWPWEALAVDGWAPAVERGLSRRYAAEGMSVAKWREQRRRERVLRVLLVTDPTEDLPGAAAECERIADILGRLAGVEISVIQGASATRKRLLAEFRSGEHDAIHFAGHAFFDPAAPGASGILCAGGRVLSGADLAALDAVPALVFFNACESGRLRRDAGARHRLARSVGLAEAFLRGGAANFIGTWWPVSDAAAARFAGTLYRRLARGSAIGPALQAARAAVRKLPSADWANYIHYGSHDFVLKERG